VKEEKEKNKRGRISWDIKTGGKSQIKEVDRVEKGKINLITV